MERRGVTCIAEALKINQSLKELKLDLLGSHREQYKESNKLKQCQTKNNIGPMGAVAKALQFNKTLKVLTLRVSRGGRMKGSIATENTQYFLNHC